MSSVLLLACPLAHASADRTVSGTETLATMNESEIAAQIREMNQPRFTGRVTLGAMASSGKAYRENTGGGSFTLGGGYYLSPRWMAGAFYRDTLSTTADLGLVGGGYFGSTTYGLETEYALVYSDTDELRVGAKAGRLTAKGIGAVFFMPTSTMEVKTWAFGPSLAYYHFFNPGLAFGIDTSYLQSLPATARTGSIASQDVQSTRIPTFGLVDVALGLQVRFH